MSWMTVLGEKTKISNPEKPQKQQQPTGNHMNTIS